MIKVRVGKIKFNPKPIQRAVKSGARSGAMQVAEHVAETARQNLISPSGGGAVGLSKQGYGGGEIVDFPQYPHYATGALLKSIQAKQDGDIAVALTDSDHAAELDSGRPQGQRPSIDELRSWAQVKGLSTSESGLRRLARRIERRGMAATGFWTTAEASGEMNATDIVAEEVGKKL